MQKVIDHFVKAIVQQEEYNELLTFNNKRHIGTMSAQVEATRSAGETRIDLLNALALIGDSVHYFADGLRQ